MEQILPHQKINSGLSFGKKVLYILLYIYSNAISAETITNNDSTLIRDLLHSYPPCCIIADNAKQALRKYYEAGDLDSVRMIMQRWKQLCYQQYEDFYTVYLFDIITGDFNSTDIDSNFFHKFLNEELRFRNNRELYLKYYNRNDTTYNSFLLHLADSISDHSDSTTIEYLIATAAGQNFDRFYYCLRHLHQFENSYLKSLYQKKTKELQEPDFFGLLFLFSAENLTYNITTGFWYPIKEYKTLGTQPILGIGIGKQFWKFKIDLNMSIRFTFDDNNFTFSNGNVYYQENKCAGGNFCLNTSYEIIRKRRWQLDAIVNKGFDIIPLHSKNIAASDSSVLQLSSSMGTGIGVKLYFGHRRKFIVNPQLTYTYLKMHSMSTFPEKLSGGAFSFNVLFHNSQYQEDENLRLLRYFEK